jgi:hypothetical protein
MCIDTDRNVYVISNENNLHIPIRAGCRELVPSVGHTVAVCLLRVHRYTATACSCTHCLHRGIACSNIPQNVDVCNYLRCLLPFWDRRCFDGLQAYQRALKMCKQITYAVSKLVLGRDSKRTEFVWREGRKKVSKKEETQREKNKLEWNKMA